MYPFTGSKVQGSEVVGFHHKSESQREFIIPDWRRHENRKI
jgi:hypothetical protein